MKLDSIDLAMHEFARKCYSPSAPGVEPVSLFRVWRAWVCWVATSSLKEEEIKTQVLLGDSKRLAQRFADVGFLVDFAAEAAHVRLSLSANPKPGGKREARSVCARSAVHAFIAANPGCSRQDIGEATGYRYPHVCQLVRRLVNARVVLDEGHSWGLRMPDAEPKKRGAA